MPGVFGKSRLNTPRRHQTLTGVKKVDDEGNSSDGVFGEVAVIISEHDGERTGESYSFSLPLCFFYCGADNAYVEATSYPSCWR